MTHIPGDTPLTADVVREKQEELAAARRQPVQEAVKDTATDTKRFSRIGDRQKELTTILGGETTVDEAAIRTKRTSEVQGLIDAINTKFAGEKAAARELGLAREGRTRALNINAGLSGSDFGSAAAILTEQENAERINVIRSNQALEIQRVLQNVNERVATEVERKETQQIEGAEREFTLLRQVQADAQADIISLAASGLGFDEFRERNPTQFADLLEQTGKGEENLRALFVNNAPEETKLGQSSAGNKVFFFFRNPVTGEQRTEEFTLDVPLATNEKVRSVTNDGQAIIETTTTNPDGSTSIKVSVRDLPGFITGGDGEDELSRTIVTSAQEKILNERGLDSELLIAIEKDIIAGEDLDNIRKELTRLNIDPQLLDVFDSVVGIAELRNKAGIITDAELKEAKDARTGDTSTSDISNEEFLEKLRALADEG